MIQNMQVSTSSITSDNHSDIDLITEDVESTTSRALKRPRIITSRHSNQSTSSPSVINNSSTPFLTSITTTNVNPKMVQIQKDKNKLSSLALNCLEMIVEDDVKDKRVYTEDVSEEDDLECSCEQILKKTKKKRG
ncbi:20089_t:CDS:1 [Cetraspora pellucida]|uniref:20089_t:CDS:1 n=1 Tax=Cetraspora pellucida TaxID=1433469 RepID=A0A9N8Z2E5_9GLOM|nr:20089_t:CDS:1 [Cetraspora pellucida]